MADMFQFLPKPKPPVREPLKCPGCGRDAENDRALAFYFSRRVTDDELRFLHDVMQRAAECMPDLGGDLA